MQKGFLFFVSRVLGFRGNGDSASRKVIYEFVGSSDGNHLGSTIDLQDWERTFSDLEKIVSCLLFLFMFYAMEDVIARLYYFCIFPKPLVKVSFVWPLGLFRFSFVSGITFAGNLFHLCLKSSGSLSYVCGREAVICLCGLESTRSKGATDVDV